MSYTSWHVGMKVVCVHRFDISRYQDSYGRRCRFPEYNGVYTIRGIYPWGPKVGIVLEEIINPRGDDPRIGLDGETGFNVIRFRPVQSRKTDISIFKHLLTNPHVRISEDA